MSTHCDSTSHDALLHTHTALYLKAFSSSKHKAGQKWQGGYDFGCSPEPLVYESWRVNISEPASLGWNNSEACSILVSRVH